MARYREIDLSPRLLPVDLDAQLVPGTFAHAVHHLVDGLDLTAFDAHYRNDDNGAPAHAPSMLLKAVLLAYSQGLVSSRSIDLLQMLTRRLRSKPNAENKNNDWYQGGKGNAMQCSPCWQVTDERYRC